ncbi:hypothetical protein ColLi_08210 [Colletotrichum liriopes]|uniref:Uncharacterized protein n=1 Tax=Colletotrichum liriopes TaxID=708192 RepID=A0AA37GR06_9PEZI|nr:hypothetical protein ColLi_08210 [Colletotrichum liriopes]
MLFKNILVGSVIGFASLGMTSPIEIAERGVVVSSDVGSVDVGEAITAVKRDIVARQDLKMPKPSGPVPKIGNTGSAATAILTIVSQVNNLISKMIEGDLAVRLHLSPNTAAVANDSPET